MNRKERVLAVVKGEAVDRVPTGFWLHFPREVHHGQAAVDAHLEFLRQTDTDILKIMNENLVPNTVPIHIANDWRHVRPISLKDGWVMDQLDIIKRVADAAGSEAVVLTTIHGTTASAFHATGRSGDYQIQRRILTNHLRENPEAVSNAFKNLSEGLAEFTAACLQAGAQGIYYAALGGEAQLFTDMEFEACIKPNDLMILKAGAGASAFNVLHICKDNLKLERYTDYKPAVVNWAIHEGNPSLEEARAFFPDSTLLGGLDDRDGVLVAGTEAEIELEVHALLDQIEGKRFILGADCTLPTEITYDRIKAAVRAAETYAQNKKCE